jgi:hypothetical protein
MLNVVDNAPIMRQSPYMTMHDHALVVQVSRPARAGSEACTTMYESRTSI